eukprot:gene55048-5357_t
MQFAQLSDDGYASAAKGQFSGFGLVAGQIGSASSVDHQVLGSRNTNTTTLPCRSAAATLHPLRGEVDWLVVDLEGSEFHVMWDMIDDGVRPSVMKFEISILKPPLVQRLSHRIADAGYIVGPAGPFDWRGVAPPRDLYATARLRPLYRIMMAARLGHTRVRDHRGGHACRRS